MQSTTLSDSLRAYLQQARRVLLPAGLIFLGFMLLPLSEPVVQALPAMQQTHLVFELLAVIVAVLIAVSTWNALEPHRCGRDCILIAGFTTVAVLDLVHALTYEHAVEPGATADPQLSIFFWLAARSVAVITLLMLALDSGPRLTRRQALGMAFVLAPTILWVGYFHLDRFPATFVPGQGLTLFKVGFEVVLCALNVAAAVVLVARANPDTLERNRMLATSCLLQAMGGLVFTQYVSIGDFFNGVGHIFKIAAYAYLYRGLYLAQIRRPFQKMQETKRQLRDTTDELAAQRQALELTLASVGQGIAKFGADGRLQFFNPRVMELLDLPESVMFEGAHLSDISNFQIERGDMDDVPGFSDPAIADLIRAREFDRVPDYYLRKSPAGRSIEVRTRVLPDGGVLRTYTDVSEYLRLNDTLKTERERLRENAHQLETTLDSISQGIVLIDPDGHIVTHNRRAHELLDLPEGLLANRPRHSEITELQRQRGDFGPDNTWVEPRARAYLSSGERDTMPDSYVRRTRHGRAIEVRTKQLPQGGMVRTFTDVTDYVQTLEALERDVIQRMAAEAEVRVLNESLEHRVAERTADLERSMKDMEAISYSIAHDLRAPLQAVNGFVSLVAQREKEQLSEASRNMLNRILAASRNMAQMIDDLLALFRVVRAELILSPVDMAGLAQATAEALASSVGPARLVIGDLPAALGDATLLKQVFSNLIDNALKYSRKAPMPHVEVGFDAGSGAYFVRDNGVGFDMAYADKLFGVFQRLHAVTEFEGSGVGLAVVSRIVERHGGQIWVEAAVGQGATFYFTLGQPLPSDAGLHAAPRADQEVGN